MPKFKSLALILFLMMFAITSTIAIMTIRRGYQKKIQDLSREIVLLRVKYEERGESHEKMFGQLLEAHITLKELSICLDRLMDREGGTATVIGTALWVWQGIASGDEQKAENRFGYLLKRLKQSGAGIEEGLLPTKFRNSPFLRKYEKKYYFIEGQAYVSSFDDKVDGSVETSHGQ